MSRLLAALVLVALLLVPLGASGQPVQPTAQPEPIRSQLVVHQGVAGMWFPMATARQLLADIEERSSLRMQVGLLDQRVQLGVVKAQLLGENLQLTLEQSNHWRQALQASLARTQASRSIWDSPTFLFFTGFVAAAVLAVGLTFGISQAESS